MVNTNKGICVIFSDTGNLTIKYANEIEEEEENFYECRSLHSLYSLSSTTEQRDSQIISIIDNSLSKTTQWKHEGAPFLCLGTCVPREHLCLDLGLLSLINK